MDAVLDQELNSIRTASAELIDARLTELAKVEQLNSMIIQLARNGASVDALSEASGYRPDQVRKVLLTEN